MEMIQSTNITLPYDAHEAFHGAFSAIVPTTFSLLLFVLSCILALGHKVYKLPLLVLKRSANDQKLNHRMLLFCVHMVLFCVLLIVENVSHIVAYALSYRGHKTGNINYMKPAYVFYYLYVSTFMFSLGMYMVLISQVFHIWLKVIQAIVQNIFTEYVLSCVYIYLILLDTFALGMTSVGIILFCLPDNAFQSHNKRKLIIGLVSMYGVTMATLALSIIGAGGYIVHQLYKSIKRFRSHGRIMTFIRLTMFLGAFVVAIVIQYCSLILRDTIPVYIKAILLDTIPHVLLIVFMSLAFWPSTFSPNTSKLTMRFSRSRVELMDRFIDEPTSEYTSTDFDSGIDRDDTATSTTIHL